MAILILIAFIVLGITSTGALQRIGATSSWRAGFVLALTACFFLIAVSTELLSAAHALNSSSIAIFWILIIIGVSAFAYQQKIKIKWPDRGHFKSGSLVLVVLILLLTLITALLGFPNNWDSMTYHLSRVMQWIHRGSVAHYPTQIERQLTLPPLAEYGILHVISLSDVPALANLVQWMCYAGSIALASLIAQSLGGNLRAQYRSAFVAATLPMAILQSSSTQNDLVVAFFVLTAMYSLLQIRAKQLIVLMTLLFFVSGGLAVMTKGTAYIFLVPVLLTFIGIAIRNRNFFQYWKPMCVGVLLAVAINAPHVMRNMQTFNEPFGNDYALQNERIGVGPLVSGVSKNMAMHMRTPSEAVNTAETNLVTTWHDVIGVDINDPALNWSYSSPFEVGYFSTHEDIAGNALHVLIILIVYISLISYKKWRRRKVLMLCAAITVVMFIAFCALLKWQIWHVRLHTPIFLAAAPLIGLWMKDLQIMGRSFLIALFLIGAGPFILVNQTRPLVWPLPIGGESIFTTSTLEDLRSNNKEFTHAYVNIRDALSSPQTDTIGLITSGDTWEFPWWKMDDSKQLLILNLMPENASVHCADVFKDVSPDAIIANRAGVDGDTLEFRGMLYTKQLVDQEYKVYLREY